MTPGHSADSDPSDDRRRPDDSLRALIASHCEGTLSRDEMQDLSERLLKSGRARAAFLEDVSIHAWLEAEISAQEGVSDHVRACVGEDVSVSPAAGPAGLRTLSPRAGVIAALAVLAASLALVTAASLLSPDGAGVPSPDGPAGANRIAQSRVVASASPGVSGCVWRFDRPASNQTDPADRDDEVLAGDTVRVEEGLLRLKFVNGTDVALQAPALIEIASAMRARLYRGRVTANVAEGAEGFTIDTPHTSVVDLGTEFGVEVDGLGRTDVVVFQGMVDVSYARDLGTGRGSELDTKRLYGGGAMRIDEHGTTSRIRWLASDRFARRGEAAPTLSRKPLITSVTDNISREESWDFYEIVAGGMREDAKAFVDRENHEWNGVGVEGMPDYLVGGDYVMTFNNDKRLGRLRVEVTLDAPAQLYVLWCTRTPPPYWLTKNFEDTGDVIGVDEGDHTQLPGEKPYVRGKPGVGPGESIDSTHSIWRAVVAKPGKAGLGPTRTSHSNINMYGIVATPL